MVKKLGWSGLITSLALIHSVAAFPRRKEKFFSLFEIIRFSNDPCESTDSSRNGTCYTSQECAAKSGTSAGACAAGFGVCCTFSVACGSTTRENCTYFESASASTPTSGMCVATVCPAATNICQLRLDFSTFVISGPSTSTTSVLKTIFGVPLSNLNNGRSVALASECLTDTFVVTNPGGSNPPVICGTNTGQHMYVDSSETCNQLIFQLGSTAVGTSFANTQWSIKISQYRCDYNNLAPSGCTQYFYGSSVGQVETFNFGRHLANQNQNICVRRERSNCRICWTASASTDFSVSGNSAKPLTTQSICCGYGSSGLKTVGFDCLTVPGAQPAAAGTKPAPSRICGRSGGLITTLNGAAATVCSTKTPFSIRFLSDQYEFTADSTKEASQPNVGFRLTFIQYATNC